MRREARLDFWFEFGSSYSYPAAMRIGRLAAAQRVGVAWRPFLLGPIFRQRGLSDSPFNLDPLKGRYMWRDLERICNAAGLPYRRPTIFPRNGLLAARVACWHQREPWLPVFVRSVFSANFANDADIADPAVVSRCLVEAGVEPTAALAAAQTDACKSRLRAQTEDAAALGVFGAPTFTVGSELFWGNDRLEVALSWASTRGT
jgi:2-hydroxychromene-2-carboxylate isomerase